MFLTTKKFCYIFFVLIFLLTLVGGCLFYKSVDIRNDYIKKGLTSSDYEKGKAMIVAMETAYGGKNTWLGYKTGTFIQVADWYGRKKISRWDTILQRFEMRSFLATDNSELTLLNGENSGNIWGIHHGKTYAIPTQKEKQFVENENMKDKLLFKNYWFQFPFRVGEAEIIAYAGEETINEKNYDVVFATWGSEKANKDFDQFLLYLNKETHYLEYLCFTVRDVTKSIRMTARFSDFKQVNQLILPHSQFVKMGKPQGGGFKFHENHYEYIKFGQ